MTATTEILLLLLSTALVNNVVLVKFLGLCPVMGVSKSMDAALGMGLLISTVAGNQFVAGQVAIITTFLPAFILSGFIFDIGSMPAPIRALTHIFAARYFVAILQTVFLAGNVWPVIGPNALALALMALFFLAAVRRRTRKRLD